MEAVPETGRLIASDTVQGTNVYNAAGQNLSSARLPTCRVTRDPAFLQSLRALDRIARALFFLHFARFLARKRFPLFPSAVLAPRRPDGVGHDCATASKRLFRADGRIVRGLMFDLGVQFGAEEDDDGGDPHPHHHAHRCAK
jgi:hypothetical protein